MKKAISVISSDWHIDKNNTEEVLDIINQKIQLIKKLKVKQAYMLGDVFQSRKAQPLIVLALFDRILQMFAKEDINLICIPGNHDKVDYKSEDSYLDEFAFHPNFKLVKNYDYNSFDIKGACLHFIPFFDDKECYDKYLSKANSIAKKDCRHFLFTHIAINGVKNNDHSIVKNDMKKEKFKLFERVFVGHYHNRSNIGKNIHYIGSIMPRNFGEDNDKGFTILYDDGSFEFIQSQFKKYEKIVIDIDKTSKKEIDNILKDNVSNEKVVRFEFVGEGEKLKALDINKFLSQGIDVRKKSRELEEGILSAENNEFIEFNKESIKEEFEEFCKLNKIENKEIGRNYLLKILK